jgi:hypothetical protein
MVRIINKQIVIEGMAKGVFRCDNCGCEEIIDLPERRSGFETIQQTQDAFMDQEFIRLGWERMEGKDYCPICLIKMGIGYQIVMDELAEDHLRELPKDDPERELY